MERIYQMSKKIEPLSVAITNNTNRTGNGVMGDVPLSYRFGLSSDHELENAPEVGLNTGAEDIKKSLSIRTGVRFNPSTSLNISFSESISSNIITTKAGFFATATTSMGANTKPAIAKGDNIQIAAVRGMQEINARVIKAIKRVMK